MKTLFEQEMQSDEYRKIYAEEALISEVMEQISLWMEQQGVTRAELARRLGTSRANITQMLRGGNVGLRRIAAAVHALGGDPEFVIRRHGSPRRYQLKKDVRFGSLVPLGER